MKHRSKRLLSILLSLVLVLGLLPTMAFAAYSKVTLGQSGNVTVNFYNDAGFTDGISAFVTATSNAKTVYFQVTAADGYRLTGAAPTASYGSEPTEVAVTAVTGGYSLSVPGYSDVGAPTDDITITVTAETVALHGLTASVTNGTMAFYSDSTHKTAITQAAAGDTVYVTVTPASTQYAVVAAAYSPTVTDNTFTKGSTAWSFTMPAAPVTVTATMWELDNTLEVTTFPANLGDSVTPSSSWTVNAVYTDGFPRPDAPPRSWGKPHGSGNQRL